MESIVATGFRFEGPPGQQRMIFGDGNIANNREFARQMMLRLIDHWEICGRRALLEDTLAELGEKGAVLVLDTKGIRHGIGPEGLMRQVVGSGWIKSTPEMFVDDLLDIEGGLPSFGGWGFSGSQNALVQTPSQLFAVLFAPVESYVDAYHGGHLEDLT